MAVDNVQTASATDTLGNTYTTGVQNDKLTNDDFLKLMLTEMKYQDPTKTMDTQQIMDSQLKMSALETNTEMAEAMKSLEKTFTQSSMGNAINYMGKKIDAVVDFPQKDSSGNIVKDSEGNVLFEKIRAPFKVTTVEVFDGEVKLNAQEYLGDEDLIRNQQDNQAVRYDGDTGQIQNWDGTMSDHYVKLNDEGRFDMASGHMVVTDENGTEIFPSYTPDPEGNPDFTTYLYGYGGEQEMYNPTTTTLNYDDVVKIYNL